MGFKTEAKGRLFVIHCPKEIDQLMGKQISIQQQKWIEASSETIALNFTEVQTIDADGFRALSVFAKAVKDADRKFVTVNPSKTMLKKIREQGLENTLNPINSH